MKFDDNAKLDTSQIDDQEGNSGGGGGGFGGFGRGGGTSGGSLGGGGIPMGKAGGGAGLIIMIVLGLLFKSCAGGGGGTTGGGATGGGLGGGYNDPFNPGKAAQVQAAPGQVDNVSTGDVDSECKTGADANNNQKCRLVAVVNDVNNFWSEVFVQNKLDYKVAKTTFFDDNVETGCGPATKDVGPFYCPVDSQAYLSRGFFEELKTKFEATGGPFAEAYVVAHEYGHHIQNLLGTSAKVEQSGDKTGPNSASVRLELQADCYAGVWASNATKGPKPLIVELTNADITAGLDAAARVGDDFIQRKFQGKINREGWTHGSSEQRQKWFNTGFQSGEPGQCDTFSGGI
jgi:uncharacterized protein